MHVYLSDYKQNHIHIYLSTVMSTLVIWKEALINLKVGILQWHTKQELDNYYLLPYLMLLYLMLPYLMLPYVDFDRRRCVASMIKSWYFCFPSQFKYFAVIYNIRNKKLLFRLDPHLYEDLKAP